MAAPVTKRRLLPRERYAVALSLGATAFFFLSPKK